MIITPTEDTYITYTLLILLAASGLLQMARILFRGRRKTKITAVALACAAATLSTGFAQAAVNEGTDGTSRWTSIEWPWDFSSIFSFGWRYWPSVGNPSNSTQPTNMVTTGPVNAYHGPATPSIWQTKQK